MKTTSIAALALVAAAGGTASADPSYSRQLDDYTLERAKDELKTLARGEGISDDATELLFKLDVFATSNDTGCPGVDVDVINATGRTVWNVEVEIKQKDGTRDRTDLLHLPYMVKDSKVRVSVSCLSDYSSRYDYGGSAPIQLNYQAKGGKNLDDALPLMQKQKRDYTAGGLGVAPMSTAGATNILEDALSMDDPAVAKELVLAIARTGVGREELGAALASYGTGAIADEVVASLQKLPPAQQAELARTLLSSSAAERWKAKLDPMIDRQLCTGNRADVIGLWIQAQTERGIPVEAFRTKIRAKCAPTKSDGPGFAGAVDKMPENAGALDAIDPALFTAVAAIWKAKPGTPGHLAFLRATRDSARFTEGAAALKPADLFGAILEVIQAVDGPAAKTKSDWATTVITQVPGTEIDGLIRRATEMLFDAKVTIPGMRDAIKSYRKLAIDVFDEVMATAAAGSSVVFDSTKVKAAGVDLADFLAFEATLGECTSTVNALEQCAQKIAANPAMAKLTKTALKPEFESSMTTIVSNLRDTDGLVAIAQELRKAGFDVGFVARNACRDAQNAVEYNGDPERYIEIAEKIAPDAPCIEDARDAATAKDRKALKFSILAILGLVVPLPIGGFLAKRRWKKVQKELPPDTTGDAPSGEKIEDRLGAQGLGRALRDGIAEAKRELAGTIAAPALGQIDDAIIFAAQSTVKRAVKSGDAATVIIKRGAEAVYLVALPVRHVRPQVVQRYLGAPWPEHLAQIQRAAGMPVLALVVLCGPDVSDASLLVAASNGTTSSDPDALLDAKDARERGANRFRFTATISNVAPAASTDKSDEGRTRSTAAGGAKSNDKAA